MYVSRCGCGCGERVGAGSRYARGHHLNPKRPAAERFWSHVRKTDGCWEWTAGTSTDGYGQIRVSRRKMRSHRFSYEMHCGPIPAGLLVCHTCDNRRCVNPAHLFLGTNAENMADMARKGRAADNNGERNPNAKLTADQVREIRRLRKAGAGRAVVARRFGVSITMVSLITSGRQWGCTSAD